MRSVHLVAVRTLEIRDVPLPPDPGPREVLVKLTAVGLCGSDMHWYLDGRIGPVPASFPQILGHEPVGTIAAIGRDVHSVAVGDRVVVEPTVSCGHCEFCLAGSHNNCVSGVFMGGPQSPGFFREYAVVPEHNVTVVPDTFDDLSATLIEPVAVMVNMLEKAPIRCGDTVAVMGAGPIGMLCAAMAKMAGASRVFIADKVAHRLKLAKQMGADVTIHNANQPIAPAILDETRGRGVDIVFDAAASAETINAGLAVARPGGTFVLVGIPSDPSIAVDINMAMAKELRIQTTKRSNHRSQAAIDILKTGRIPGLVVTHQMPLEQTAQAFDLLANYAEGVGKILIRM